MSIFSICLELSKCFGPMPTFVEKSETVFPLMAIITRIRSRTSWVKERMQVDALIVSHKIIFLSQIQLIVQSENRIAIDALIPLHKDKIRFVPYQLVIFKIGNITEFLNLERFFEIVLILRGNYNEAYRYLN